jgi:hypothetical protein
MEDGVEEVIERRTQIEITRNRRRKIKNIWNQIEIIINRKEILKEGKAKKGEKEGNDQKEKEKINVRKK